MSKIWANAVLKDGKLMFWWTDSKRKKMWDFYKDSPHGYLRMKRALQTGRYKLINRKVDKMEDAQKFYSQYELYSPYENSKTILSERFYEQQYMLD